MRNETVTSEGPLLETLFDLPSMTVRESCRIGDATSGGLYRVSSRESDSTLNDELPLERVAEATTTTSARRGAICVYSRSPSRLTRRTGPPFLRGEPHEPSSRGIVSLVKEARNTIGAEMLQDFEREGGKGRGAPPRFRRIILQL